MTRPGCPGLLRLGHERVDSEQLTPSVAQPITAKSKADLRGAGLRELLGRALEDLWLYEAVASVSHAGTEGTEMSSSIAGEHVQDTWQSGLFR